MNWGDSHHTCWRDSVQSSAARGASSAHEWPSGFAPPHLDGVWGVRCFRLVSIDPLHSGQLNRKQCVARGIRGVAGSRKAWAFHRTALLSTEYAVVRWPAFTQSKAVAHVQHLSNVRVPACRGRPAAVDPSNRDEVSCMLRIEYAIHAAATPSARDQR
jgi:hypothetical protein